MIRFLAVLLFTALGASVSFADDDALKAQLQARYDEFSRQIDAMNWDAVRAIEAPDYRSVDTDGSFMTGEEELEAIQQQPQDENEDGRTTVVSVRLVGSLAYVEQRVDVRSSLKDDAGKDHAVETHAKSSDIWKLIDGQWLILQTVTNQIDTTVDGMTVDHRVKPAV